MLNRLARAVSVAGLALALSSAATAESLSRRHLPAHVRVDAASVTLADLLPAAPAGMRARAARIVLGAAPLAGSLRRFSREEIERRLGPELAREIEAPESVVVERQARELSREEVFAAIRAALEEKGFANAVKLRPADLQLEMPVMVALSDTGVRVVAMSFDPTLGLAVFRMWTAKEPQIRPFDVMVRPVDGMGAWLETTNGGERKVPARAHISDQAAAARRERRPRGKPLVMALHTAILVLLTGTMEIHTTAEALEPGYLGQIIRVRMTSTRQVLRAKVVGTDCLEAGF
ncbi:MAG: flagella basal body P-ring formation protein FlgA [Acidobacteriota bacterium]|nr:flagella basal body P-ring formation protein FlgA [Acidobacteriota bacterium]